jgi:MFS transporter, putative metabolite:H+ symporter
MATDKFQQIRFISPIGSVGAGISSAALDEARAQAPHFIACDAGTTDAGPFSLGMGISAFPREAVKRDLSLMLRVGKASFDEILRPPYRRRTIVLTVFNFLQAIAFYGFGNCLPALVNAQNDNAPRSAQAAFLITLAFPIGPLLWSTIAERYERKWQIVGAAVGTAVFGLLFAAGTTPSGLVVLGILITLMNSLLGYSSHAYQAELFPTRMRARAVGFVYSWGRLSTALSSLIIGFLLQRFGNPGVFALIALAMFVVVVSVGVFGPRTRDLTLEQISD